MRPSLYPQTSGKGTHDENRGRTVAQSSWVRSNLRGSRQEGKSLADEAVSRGTEREDVTCRRSQTKNPAREFHNSVKKHELELMMDLLEKAGPPTGTTLYMWKIF